MLTHGLAASEAVWPAQVQALAPHYRVVTWDLRDHGRSSPQPAPCTFADLAGDLEQVLDSAGIERAVIAGHSAGGVWRCVSRSTTPGGRPHWSWWELPASATRGRASSARVSRRSPKHGAWRPVRAGSG